MNRQDITLIPIFGKHNENMEAFFSSILKILPAERLLRSDQLSDRYYHIWKMDESPAAVGMAFPESVEELSHLCKICFEFDQPMVVFGGLTNLVGATETNGSEFIISMERMNSILELDKESRTIHVEAGAILEHVQMEAEKNDLMLAMNFGAKGSAQIGGMIATNAGGLRVLKYGMTRNLVKGLEVVMADGTIISSLKKITKDNSGYDLKQMFIGSEGTLGIISSAILSLEELPKSRNSAFVGFNSFSKVIEFLKYVDQNLSGSLSGFEVIWKDTYECITAEETIWKPVLPYGYEFYILVESLGSDHDLEYTKLEKTLSTAFENNLILDAALANNSADLNWFWGIREDVSLLNAACTIDQHFDISAPISQMEEYTKNVYLQLLKIDGVQKVFTFGHLADGNIHFIVGKEDDSDELRLAINDIVYSPLKQIEGSVSAEHGIGLHKKDYLHLCRNQNEIELMKMIKSKLDPKGLLNPGKVLS